MSDCSHPDFGLIFQGHEIECVYCKARWVPVAEVERLRGECCVCEKCGHVQAEPNWCHECGHRTSMPEWAKPLVEAFHEAKLLRDIGERMCEALRHEANALCDEWDNEVAAPDLKRRVRDVLEPGGGR